MSLISGIIMKKSFLLILVFTYSFGARANCKTPFISVLNKDTKFKTYTPKGKESSGQVLVLPPTGGENFSDRRIARKLCRSGLLVHVLNYPQPSGMTLDLGIHERTTQLVLNSVEDFMLEYPQPTVIVGASLGGIYASVIYSLAIDKNPDYEAFFPVKGLVTAVAGGSLVDILMNSKIEGAVQQRQLRMSSGVYRDREDYRDQLERAIFTDPLKLARPSDSVLSYISLNDKKVPTKNQFQLARAHGAKIRTIRLLGHPSSVLYTYYSQGNEISYFIKKVLN